MAKTAKTTHPPEIASLTQAQAKVEHKRLALELERHDQLYYQDDAPDITDAAYDALRRRFNAIEARFPDLVTGASRNSGTRCRCCRSTTPSPNRMSLIS